jgi:ATP-dependent protease ClpP protease subunit
MKKKNPMAKYLMEAVDIVDDESTPVIFQEHEPLTVERVADNHIYFYASVDTDRCLALIQKLRNIDHELREEYITRDLPKDFPQTPVWLHIQSGGGGLFAGLAIADQMKNIQSPIYSVVEGYCASAATLISMSCTRRYIQPSAFMLIHQLSGVAWGTYEQIQDEVHLMDMAMDKLVGFYVDKSNGLMDSAMVRDLLKRDSWFNAEEAVEMGLADKVIDHTRYDDARGA